MLQSKDSWRGWSVVGAAFAGMLFSVGVLVVYSFGVLSSAMTADLGWGAVERSTLFVSFSICSTIAGPIWGMIADRVGARRAVLVSSVLLAGCFCLLAAVPRDPVFSYLVFAAAGLLGGGTLPPTYASVVVGWFDRHRGLALGISMMGVGAGAAVLPIVAAAITSQFGWRHTSLAFAAFVMLISLPIAAMLLRQYPEAETPRAAGAGGAPGRMSRWSILRQTKTWILLTFAFLTGAVLLACVTNFVPLLQSRGETLVGAARFQSLLGVSLIAGRIITGALLDRLFAPRVMAAVLLVTAAGMAILQSGDGSLAYAMAAIGIGLAIGAEVDFLGFMVSKYFDRTSFATIFGLMFATYSLGASMGPLLFGWLVQRSGSYDQGLLICSLLMLLVSAAMFALPRYSRD